MTDKFYDKRVKEIGDYYFATHETEKVIAEKFGVSIHIVKGAIECYIYRRNNKLI